MPTPNKKKTLAIFRQMKIDILKERTLKNITAEIVYSAIRFFIIKFYKTTKQKEKKNSKKNIKETALSQ
jgi:hypothetical protein